MTSNSTGGSASVATEVSFRPLAFAGATATFLVIGATSSLFGPLLVPFAHRFHLSLATAGTVLSVFFVGALFGVLIAWLGVKHLHGASVLAIDLGLMAIGSTGIALSNHWALFLACVAFMGLGFGGLDFSLNTLLARTAATGRALRLSAANAGFGVGAVIGPLLIIAAHPHNFRYLFAGVAGASLVLATLTRGVHAPPLRAEESQRQISLMTSERRPILATFVVAYVLYISLESVSSGWLATQLHGVGYSETVASLVTAGFWGGVAVSRIFGGPLHRLFSERTLVLGGLAFAVALSLSSLVTPLAPYAFPMMGLSIALIFPMGLVWYTELCPHDSDGLALMILLMMAGGVIGPGAASLMVSHFGVRAVPFVLATFGALDVAVFSSALRFKRVVVA
jgi:FHS family glucose/mannose:H+ symporter-like MFS transporter